MSHFRGHKADLLIIDDPYAVELDPLAEERARALFTQPLIGAKDVMGGYSYSSQDPKCLEELQAKHNEMMKPRFGQVVRDWGDVAQMRRQKKAPHKEVLYVWVTAIRGQPDDAKRNYSKALRSVNNCSNDQIVEAIRNVGSAIESRAVSQVDAELILDLLYLELGQRSESADQLRAKRYQGQQCET